MAALEEMLYTAAPLGVHLLNAFSIHCDDRLQGFEVSHMFDLAVDHLEKYYGVRDARKLPRFSAQNVVRPAVVYLPPETLRYILSSKEGCYQIEEET